MTRGGSLRGMALIGLVIGPALAAQLLILPDAGWPRVAGLVAAALLLGLAGALIGRRPRDTGTACLLVRAEHARRARALLPPSDVRHDRMLRLLRAADEAAPDIPPGRDEAIGQLIRRIMQRWNRADLSELSEGETLALGLVDHLCVTGPDDAGSLARMFHRPDALLDLRARVERLTAERAAHDRARAAFGETRALWEDDAQAEAGAAPRGLTRRLRTLNTVDIDLWHHVVLAHDPDDPDQRDAALFCVSQTDCDRATVAAWIALTASHADLAGRLAEEGRHLTEALRQVITHWNDGAYRTAELALDPPDRLLPLGPRALKSLSKLAQSIGEPPLPEPKGLFATYQGRPARDRSFWCLETGRLTAPPSRSAYLGSPVLRQAA